MHRAFSFRLSSFFLAGLAAPVAAASAQRSDLSVTPFMSFLPSTGASPLAGLALTLGGTSGLAFRASGSLALHNDGDGTAASTESRPWGADADAVFFFGGGNSFSRSFAPFVFTGLGIQGVDNIDYTTTRNNWSYGIGATLPLSRSVDLFGQSRWRMTEFVLPTAEGAPPRTNELSLGLSFRVGGGDDPQPARRGRRWR